jgi:hypothetical protein
MTALALFAFVYANDVDALVPEMWAQESLMVLEENMQISGMVHRDFQTMVAAHGDVINTRKPADFTAKRKGVNDSVTIQDATVTNVQVPLDQLVHVSFLLRDGEESKSFKDLVAEFLRPALIAQARFLDQVVLGQVHRFLMAKAAGGLGLLTSTTAKQYILDTRQILNENKCPVEGRNLFLTPNSESAFLALDLFVSTEQVGDSAALREASLGRKLGFNMFMSQNTPSIAAGNTTLAGAVNLTAGYAKGHAAAIVVDGFTGAVTVGEWLTIAGDMTPYQITATAATLGNTTSITLDQPLRRAIADNAVITSYVGGAVNLAAGYAAGWAKEIVVDAFTVAPRVGQMVTFGTTATVYTIIQVTGLTSILLDRPLSATIADNAAVNLGPMGEYNFAFHKNALALVCRPLAAPRAGVGAASAVINYNGLSVRCTITYDGEKQGHLITIDMLCGVALLDQLLGCILLG